MIDLCAHLPCLPARCEFERFSPPLICPLYSGIHDDIDREHGQRPDEKGPRDRGNPSLDPLSICFKGVDRDACYPQSERPDDEQQRTSLWALEPRQQRRACGLVSRYHDLIISRPLTEWMTRSPSVGANEALMSWVVSSWAYLWERELGVPWALWQGDEPRVQLGVRAESQEVGVVVRDEHEPLADRECQQLIVSHAELPAVARACHLVPVGVRVADERRRQALVDPRQRQASRG